MSLSTDMENALLGYFANDDSHSYQSLTTIFEKVSRPVEWRESFFSDLDSVTDKDQLRVILDQMVIDGLLQRDWGERDYEGSYRATDQGTYEAAFVDDAPLVPSANVRWTDGSDLPSDYINDRQPFDADPPFPGRVAKPQDSTTWTGKQFVLLDAKILSDVRAAATELRSAVYSLNFRTDADRADVVGLVEALVAITKMAEPEVTLIDRILASPKFKAYTSLFGIIAAIRGALGI